MKIIGETKEGFIAILSNSEMANLTGYDSIYSGGYNKPRIDDFVNITSLYNKTSTIETLLNNGLVDAINDLDKKVKALIIAKKLFEDILVRETKKE